jgi:PTS system nitrogen regulatory IIA component
MHLEEYLQPEFVIGELAAETKHAVLAELVAPLKALWPDFDAERALRVLEERESLGTTGIGDGVAIPHGKMESLERIVIVVGRSLKGVNFDALDFKPCRIFFLVLAPEHVAGLHLRILAQISRLLSDEAFRHAFMSAEDDAALWKVLTDAA